MNFDYYKEYIGKHEALAKSGITKRANNLCAMITTLEEIDFGVIIVVNSSMSDVRILVPRPSERDYVVSLLSASPFTNWKPGEVVHIPFEGMRLEISPLTLGWQCILGYSGPNRLLLHFIEDALC